MDRHALTRAADANLAVKATYVQSQLPGMTAHVSPALAWGDCGLPCDTFNQVCQARLSPETVRAQVQAIVDHFTAVHRPFAWWHSPWDQPVDLSRYLEAAGLEAAESELAMASDLHHLHVDGEVSPGLRTERARTPAALRHFAGIVAANWSPPDPWVLRFYDLAAPVVLAADSPLWFFVGYLDGTPGATSEIVLGGGVAGLYSVCTLEAYRRRGLGAAMTTHALLAARSAGCETAILQASASGAGIYARVGFQAFGEITEYKPTRGF